jgi:hypothetical protein
MTDRLDLHAIEDELNQAAIPPVARVYIEALIAEDWRLRAEVIQLRRTVDAVKALPEHYLQVRDNPPRLDPTCTHIRAGAWEEAARRLRNVIQATEGT